MNLGELREELATVVMDSSLEDSFTGWINNAILEIAKDFYLPALKLKEPVELEVTESDWLYDMPSSYHKKLFKCYNSNSSKVTIHRDIGYLDSLDVDHEDTSTYVSDVAIAEGDSQIGIYPMCDDTLRLWYYENPTLLTANSDEPDYIPEEYHYRVIISKVIIRAYHLLMDLSVNPPHKSLEWWKNNYRVGLYGERGGDMGMINCIARNKKPKRTGGKCPLP